MTNETITDAGETVRALSGAIDRVLRPLLPPGTSCALLDFPNHANVGDSAIWLGETEWLRRNGVSVVFACDMEHYSPERLAARLGGGVILLHGGGNLGDFWVAHQQFREQVIQDFPDNPIVQLPQTIHFLDAWGVGEARRVFNAHRNLTLLCRDGRSLNFARRDFGVASTLCPDLAFALGSRPRAARPSVDVLWLARTDAESLALPLPGTGDGVERTDWLDEPATSLRERYLSLCREPGRGSGADASADALVATCDDLARERLDRGCSILSRGRAVVTDRLHGHVLCLLLGIPHVLLDNNYGKVRGFHETWTRECGLGVWAEGPAEALARARQLAATPGTSFPGPPRSPPG
jgi:pyruvyl transferase EpsO